MSGNTVICSECGTAYCKNCDKDKLYKCEDCGDTICEDCVHTDSDGDHVCSECYDDDDDE